MSKETKDVEICLVEFAEAVMKELKAIKENQKKMWKILSRSKEMRTVVYSRAYGDGLFCSKHNAEATGIYNDYMHESNQIEDVENVPRHDHILNHVAQKMKLGTHCITATCYQCRLLGCTELQISTEARA